MYSLHVLDLFVLDLRLPGYVICVFLPSLSSILLQSFPGTCHVMLCPCVCLPCLCWFEYWLMSEPCMSVLRACSSSSSLVISWDVWLGCSMFGVSWSIKAMYQNHIKDCYPVRGTCEPSLYCCHQHIWVLNLLSFSHCSGLALPVLFLLLRAPSFLSF